MVAKKSAVAAVAAALCDSLCSVATAYSLCMACTAWPACVGSYASGDGVHDAGPLASTDKPRDGALCAAHRAWILNIVASHYRAWLLEGRAYLARVSATLVFSRAVVN
jgi:hypothetical protein